MKGTLKQGAWLTVIGFHERAVEEPLTDLLHILWQGVAGAEMHREF